MTSAPSRVAQNGMIALKKKEIDTSRAACRGTIVLPGDRDYNEARSLWNGMVDRRPALIARCTNVTGNAMCDGGIVINLSLMRRCDVDVGRRMVHVDGGGGRLVGSGPQMRPAIELGGNGGRECLNHDFPVAHKKGVGCQLNSRLGFPNDICDLSVHIPAQEFESHREPRRGLGQKSSVELTQLRHPPIPQSLHRP